MIDQLLPEKDPCGEMVKEPSIINTLKRRKKVLEESLTNVNNALKALEENPKIMEVLELIAKTR